MRQRHSNAMRPHSAEHVRRAHSVALNKRRGDRDWARARRPRGSERRAAARSSCIKHDLFPDGPPRSARSPTEAREGRAGDTRPPRRRELDHPTKTETGPSHLDPQTSSPARGAPHSVPRARRRLRRAQPLPLSQLVLRALGIESAVCISAPLAALALDI